MPVLTSYPGVYIEEIPSGVRPIVGVSTSIAAFVGYFGRGPLDRAVQILSMGDFEREFGGLHVNSEASYAIRQFFMNGGTQAYAVRTLRATTFATAQIEMQSSASAAIARAMAGRRVQDTSVVDPGSWGNSLRIDVDYDTNDPAAEFNLTVSEIRVVDGRETPVRSETYRNLSMDPDAIKYAVEVVNEASKLIQLTRQSAPASHTRPAQTGTVGLDASAAGTDAVGNVGDADDLNVSISGGAAQLVTLNFATPPTTLGEVAAAVETALRATGAALTPAEPLLTGTTVRIVNESFRVQAGSTGTAAVLIFSEAAGTTAVDLGLLGAGVSANVQQYFLGGASLGFQAVVAGGVGSDGTLPNDLPDALALEGMRANKSGIYALEDVDLFNILCIPEAADLSAGMDSIYSAAAGFCEEERAVLLVDLPTNVDTPADAKNWLTANATLRHKNAVAYFPRPRIPDPLSDSRLRAVGASGTMAGVFARTDSERGVWKAPAGIDSGLRNVPDLAYRLTDLENGQLNPEGLNCLRNFDTFGNVSWGARTLVGADKQASEWKYIPVRRMALFLEESLYRGTQWVVFEPNDEPLWAQIRLNIGAFMQNLFRKGAFQGSTPRQAYLVKCDSETTTQADIDVGIVNILVGFAPLKPAEFVIIKLQQLAGQTQA